MARVHQFKPGRPIHPRGIIVRALISLCNQVCLHIDSVWHTHTPCPGVPNVPTWLTDACPLLPCRRMVHVRQSKMARNFAVRVRLFVIFFALANTVIPTGGSHEASTCPQCYARTCERLFSVTQVQIASSRHCIQVLSPLLVVAGASAVPSLVAALIAPRQMLASRLLRAPLLRWSTPMRPPARQRTSPTPYRSPMPSTWPQTTTQRCSLKSNNRFPSTILPSLLVKPLLLPPSVSLLLAFLLP